MGISPPRIEGLHLRRALLLFAIVLGLAAIAASVSRPRNASDPFTAPSPTTQTEEPPTAAPGDSSPAAQLTFFADDPDAQRIRAGQAATVLVEVEQAGQVQIADLGMNAVAEPETPARFEVFAQATGRHPITFMPAAIEDEQLRVGTLVVTDAR